MPLVKNPLRVSDSYVYVERTLDHLTPVCRGMTVGTVMNPAGVEVPVTSPRWGLVILDPEARAIAAANKDVEDDVPEPVVSRLRGKPAWQQVLCLAGASMTERRGKGRRASLRTGNLMRPPRDTNRILRRGQWVAHVLPPMPPGMSKTGRPHPSTNTKISRLRYAGENRM